MSSEKNATYLDLSQKLGLQIQDIIVGQKIYSSKPNNFDMIITFFFIKDKERRSCFFEETFLLDDIKIDVALEISFLLLNNVKINFVGQYFN